ncbi:MAG: CDP-glycerol glycerophosphotransferase (TagB/SpsB family) [Candidatus Paceibacteria bacterium]|jgi:CDP-glycerol glycerophosphotransferase (TagB/SpsB family)
MIETLKKIPGLRQIIGAFRILFSWTVYTLSLFVPRNNGTWVFMGWHYEGEKEIFADNAKYLFLHVSHNKEKYNISRAIWLTKDKVLQSKLKSLGHEAYLRKSILGIFYALTAGYTIVDAYIHFENWKYSGWTKIIQLWHGIPIKKIGFQKKGYPISPEWKARLMFPAQFMKIHKLFCTSQNQATTYTEAFNYKKESIEIAEYPRNISMTKTDLLEEEINIGVDTELLNILKEKRNSKNLIYTPTFRRGEKLVLEKVFDLNKMSEWLQKKNYLLTIGLHPKNFKEVEGKEFKNIYFLKNSDLYPLLKYIDMLITDYSSISLDFLFTNKPMVFYPYDLENYQKTEGFTVNYTNTTPGKKVFNFNDLLLAIEATFENDIWKEARDRVKKEYHPYSNEDALERTTKLIIS